MKDDWRLDPLVARVVAWHNRHPLARRITAQQVRSLGFVALPFAVSVAVDAAARAAGAAGADPGAAATGPAPSSNAPAEAAAHGSLRERAMARSQPSVVRPDAAADDAAPVATLAPPPRGARRAAFSEDFIAPIAPARVARWAARHARPGVAAPGGGPLRQVAVDDARVPFGHRVLMCHALTAAVESGGQRTRLLLGADPRAPVLGRRLWSRQRTTVAGLGAMALLSLALGALMAAPPDGYPAPVLVAVAVPAAASAATTAVASTPPAGGAATPVMAAAAPAMAGSAAAAAEEPLPAAAPVDVEPRLGRVELPPLRPPLDDAVRVAARAARAATGLPPQAAAGAGASSPGAAVPTSELALDTPRPPPPAAAAMPQDSYWAVTTRPLRTRAESLQWLQAVDALLRAQGSASLQVELLPEGEDWRVVGWPFTRRADAERARAMLLARGLKVDVVDF